MLIFSHKLFHHDKVEGPNLYYSKEFKGQTIFSTLFSECQLYYLDHVTHGIVPFGRKWVQATHK